MKKVLHFSVMLTIGLIVALDGFCQTTFVPYVDAYKVVTSGGVPSRIAYVDVANFGIYGDMDSLHVYDTTASNPFTIIERVYGLHGTAKKSGTGWVNAGNVNTNGGIYTHATATDHREYVGCEEPYPHFLQVLDVNTNTYEAIPEINLINGSGIFYIFDWKNNNLFFTGGFNEVDSEYHSAVIWNTTTKKSVFPEGPWADDAYYHLDPNHTLYVSHDNVVITDENTDMYPTRKVYALSQGDSTWQATAYPAVPQHGNRFRFAGEKMCDLYCIGSTLDDSSYNIYHSKNFGAWEKIATVIPVSYFYTPSIKVIDGLLYVNGYIATFNGKPTNGIVVYDPNTNTSKDLVDVMPVYGNNIGQLYSIGGKLYMVALPNVGWPQKTTLYVLRNSGTLPITLASFDAALNGKSVELSWRTTEELNTDRFEVERSGDGSTFTKVGTLPAHGAGSYSYNDVPSAIGNVYYRLRSVDKDGRSQYSEVKMVTLGHVMRLYPNPTADHVTIVLSSSGSVHVDILNMNGTIIARDVYEGVSGTTINIPVAHLAKGLYFLAVHTPSGVFHMKFIKE